MAVWRRLRPSKGRCPAPDRRAAPAMGLCVVMTLLRARLRAVGGCRFVPGRSAHVRSEATVSGGPAHGLDRQAETASRRERLQGRSHAPELRFTSVRSRSGGTTGSRCSRTRRSAPHDRPRRAPGRPLAPQGASGGSLVDHMPMLWTGCSRSAPALSDSTSAALATRRRCCGYRFRERGSGSRAAGSGQRAAGSGQRAAGTTKPGPGGEDATGTGLVGRRSGRRAQAVFSRSSW